MVVGFWRGISLGGGFSYARLPCGILRYPGISQDMLGRAFALRVKPVSFHEGRGAVWCDVV